MTALRKLDNSYKKYVLEPAGQILSNSFSQVFLSFLQNFNVIAKFAFNIHTKKKKHFLVNPFFTRNARLSKLSVTQKNRFHLLYIYQHQKLQQCYLCQLFLLSILCVKLNISVDYSQSQTGCCIKMIQS